MSKKLLLLLAFLLTITMNAQTDEASGATPTLLSATYDCENAEIDDFQGFTKSAEFNCPGSEYATWVDSWYTFTPSETRVYSIEIEALNTNNQNVRIGIYTGTPGNLTSQTGCATRYYDATLNSGQTYYINTRGATENTQYRMCVYAFPDQPSNDEPVGADTLMESTFDVCENPSVGYTSSGTHSSESTCGTTTPDVWYSFTPSQTGEYTFKTTLLNGAAPTYIGIYSGTPGFLNALSETFPSPTVQCQDIILAQLTAGTTYYVSVASSMSSQAIYFELCAYLSPAPPVNDDCTNPTALTVGATFEESYIIATNTSATVNASNSNFPDCETLDFSTRGRDVWFTVVVPASGSFTIETRLEPTETNISDTGMETYTGSCGTSTLIPFYYDLPPPNQGTAYCNGQFVIGGNQFAGIYFTDKTPGELVYVRVWGWSLQFGKFRIGAYDATLGVNEFDLDNFSYYPNPINNELNIKYSKNMDEVIIYNMLGKAVIRKETNDQLITLNVSDLASGIYIATVKSGNELTNFKVIKK